MPSLFGVIHETRPGCQVLGWSGSKVRGGAEGAVSRCSGCRGAMLREAGVKAGVGITQAGRTQKSRSVNGVR